MIILGHSGAYRASKFDCFKVEEFSFSDSFFVMGYERVKYKEDKPKNIILATYATEADAKAALHDLIYAIAENAQLHKMKPREAPKTTSNTPVSDPLCKALKITCPKCDIIYNGNRYAACPICGKGTFEGVPFALLSTDEEQREE